MLPNKTTRPRRGRGFALVVTLSLMILLSILAVGMLGLSTVALRTSSQGDSQSEARANARMALMMAIAELQKELGPDSRISAPGDTGKDAPGGSAPPANGQPRWTAVYDAWKWNTDPSTPETPQSRVTKFRRWLVSGANQANGGPAGTGEILLVGSNSLSTGAKPEDQIKVPMLPVSRDNRKGMIAWWTSDESSKAKINAGGDTLAVSNPLSEAQSPRYIGHTSIDTLKNLVWKPGQRSAAVSTSVVNLAADLNSGGLGRLSHDVTVHSNSVIADVRGGHLKRDLSNLLARPVTDLENKPLYVADGRINHFQISADGSLINDSWVTPNAADAGRWGINLEELHLFHQIHREVDWSTGKPQLIGKNNIGEIAKDRFYIYRQPVIEAMQVILSFRAIPDGAPDTFKIQGMMDAMIATSNPNDINIVWPSSLNYRMEMHSFPYLVDWDIRKKNNPDGSLGPLRITHRTGTMNAPFFRANIRNGFTLQPGEAAVFGSSLADVSARSSNLTRGFAPRGGVAIADGEWDPGQFVAPDGSKPKGLHAVGLARDDLMNFAMIKATGSSLGDSPSGWFLCPKSVSNSGSTATPLNLGAFSLSGGSKSLLYSPLLDKYLLPTISPPQRLAIQEFIDRPIPVMMITLMPNVEKSRSILPPNALASRSFHFREPAVAGLRFSTQSATEQGMHASQLLILGETMDYEFANPRVMPDSTGKNLYHGAARELGQAGSLSVVKRRIPLAAPLSLGAFENAIACGLTARFSPGGTALSGNANGLPAMAKAIGNSWPNPFILSDSVFSGSFHDPSWMANTALWDSWFLSGVVAPNSSNSTWKNDTRNQREQFRDLAEGIGSLRNTRLTYHPHKPTTEALDELFNGDNLKPESIEKLSKYLLVDGAFNVNSTSETAWKAFLTSVKDQEILDSNGAATKMAHPFGTLGHAVNSATTSPEGDWSGFRDLTDSELEAIAKAMVTEVKARGPFLSMADFVNRRPNSSDATHKAVGALQAAIDKSGINAFFKKAGRTLAEADVSVFAGKDTLIDESRAIGAAGHLSQAALLTAFGSQITVRGDTFIIRTYGDSRDTAGNIQAKAWCEAVVQRAPEYVDPTNPPETSASLSTANTEFGRKFNVVSFRWLSPDEL